MKIAQIYFRHLDYRLRLHEVIRFEYFRLLFLPRRAILVRQYIVLAFSLSPSP